MLSSQKYLLRHPNLYIDWRLVNPNYPLVARRAGHRCEYCRAPEAIFNMSFEIDHIKPTTKGGANKEVNWALACRACNGHKSNAEKAIDPLTLQRVPLFNPRQQVWKDHFEVERETFRIKGQTAIGRATVERLRMNARLQLAARAKWAQLNLFP